MLISLRSTFIYWFQNYRDGGFHLHLEVNIRLSISEGNRKKLREVLNPTLHVHGASCNRYWVSLHIRVKQLEQEGKNTSALRSDRTETIQYRQARLNWFAHYCKQKMTENRKFLEGIDFLDRRSFRIGCAVNKQSIRIWSMKCPDSVYELSQGTQSFMVLCTISESELIAASFSDDCTVTGDRYKRML